MKNNLGFTMTELLAAVVILGILMAMAIPSVAGLLTKQKNKMYVEDAIRLGQLAEKKMKSDNSILVPGTGKCIVMSLKYLDDGTFDSAPYGSEYDKDYSLVVIKRLDEYYKYGYYVRLVEKVGSNYRGINLIPIDNPGGGGDYLHMKNIKNKVSNYASFDVPSGDSFSAAPVGCGGIETGGRYYG